MMIQPFFYSFYYKLFFKYLFDFKGQNGLIEVEPIPSQEQFYSQLPTKSEKKTRAEKKENKRQRKQTNKIIDTVGTPVSTMGTPVSTMGTPVSTMTPIKKLKKLKRFDSRRMSVDRKMAKEWNERRSEYLGDDQKKTRRSTIFTEL